MITYFRREVWLEGLQIGDEVRVRPGSDSWNAAPEPIGRITRRTKSRLFVEDLGRSQKVYQVSLKTGRLIGQKGWSGIEPITPEFRDGLVLNEARLQLDRALDGLVKNRHKLSLADTQGLTAAITQYNNPIKEEDE